MDGQFQLYKKSPFQFNDNNLILCPPQNMSGTLSAYVQSELDKLDTFYTNEAGSANPPPRVARPVNGEETEFYLSTNFDYWKKLLANTTRDAGQGVKLLLADLKKCNLLEYTYAPESWTMNAYGTAQTPLSKTTALKYYFDVLRVDIVPPSEEDLEARSTDAKPGAGNTVKGFADVITFRLNVRRNKMLEAYLVGDFDSGDICSGNIIRASRGFLIDLLGGGANEACFAYPIVKPTGATGTPTRRRALPSYGSEYYVFCSGTFLSTAEGASPRPLLVTFINTEKTAAQTVTKGEIGGIVTYTDADEAIYRGSGSADDAGHFTPNAVYIIDKSFLETDAGLSTPAIDTDNLYDIKASGGFWLSQSAVVKDAELVGKKIYASSPYNKIATIGTNNTRVSVGGKLINETLDGTSAPIGGDPLARNIFLRMRFANGGTLKISLNVNGESTDITDDFSVPLTPSNIAKSELQAQKIARLSNFIQQGGRIVTGAATAAAGVASGGAAFLPAAIAGGEQIFSGAAGIYSSIVAGAPKPTATQQGSADGVTNATTLGGLYFETNDAENAIEVIYAAEAVGYNCNVSLGTVDGLGNKNVVHLFSYPNTYPIQDDNARVLQIENPIFSSGADKETRGEIETKLRAGAILCYGINAIKRKTGE